MPPLNLKRRRSSWGDAVPDLEATRNTHSEKPKTPGPGVAADLYFRTLYTNDPDFKELGRRYPAFGKLYVKCSFLLSRMWHKLLRLASLLIRCSNARIDWTMELSTSRTQMLSCSLQKRSSGLILTSRSTCPMTVSAHL